MDGCKIMKSRELLTILLVAWRGMEIAKKTAEDASLKAVDKQR